MSLIKKIAAGDVRALERLYEQLGTRVYRLAMSILGDTYGAEDIVQETFLRVQEKATAYKREESDAAWVFAIARNLAMDRIRKNARERLSCEEEFPETTESEKGYSDILFLDMISDLSGGEREVVSLRIVAELKWDEIGRILGIGAEAARKRYSRSLEKLRRKNFYEAR